jgi:hypothetical protein
MTSVTRRTFVRRDRIPESRPLKASGRALGVPVAELSEMTRHRLVRRRLVLALMVAISLGGCSYQASSAASTPEADCVRLGGRWHSGTGGYEFCERGGGGA